MTSLQEDLDQKNHHCKDERPLCGYRKQGRRPIGTFKIGLKLNRGMKKEPAAGQDAHTAGNSCSGFETAGLKAVAHTQVKTGLVHEPTADRDVKVFVNGIGQAHQGSPIIFKLELVAGIIAHGIIP